MIIPHRSSIITSYLIGAPLGLLLILLTFFIVTESDLDIYEFVINEMGYSIIALIIGFLFSLRLSAIVAHDLLAKGRALIYVSICYSLIVNFLMWFSFVFIQIIHDLGPSVFLRVPIIGFVLCFPFSILTIGLLMSHMIKKKMKLTNALI